MYVFDVLSRKQQSNNDTKSLFSKKKYCKRKQDVLFLESQFLQNRYGALLVKTPCSSKIYVKGKVAENKAFITLKPRF